MYTLLFTIVFHILLVLVFLVINVYKKERRKNIALPRQNQMKGYSE